MNRLSKYQDMITKFIDKRSCILDIDSFDNKELKNMIDDHMKKSKFILPIMGLTLLNNYNKKHKITFQGYYLATSIELMTLLHNDKYNNIIIALCIKSFGQNIDIVKKNVSGSVFNNINMNFYNICMNCFVYDDNNTFYLVDNDDKDNKDNENLDNNTDMGNNLESYKYKHEINNYLCKDNNLKQCLMTNKNIFDKHKFDNLYIAKYINQHLYLFYSSWVLGNGEKKVKKQIKQLAIDFMYVYHIAHDFENLIKDIKNIKTKDMKTYNYILNRGFQNSYDKYLKHKHSFVESITEYHLESATIKEIMDYLEEKVDTVIDNTSPEIKSSYTSKFS